MTELVKFKNFKKTPVVVNCTETGRTVRFEPFQERELAESYTDMLLAKGIVPMDEINRVQAGQEAEAEAQAEAERKEAEETAAVEAARAEALAQAKDQAEVAARQTKRAATKKATK